MAMPDEFQYGTNWQQSSGPYVNVNVHESDCWPVDDNSESGTKDHLADGLHPVIAIGQRLNGNATVRPMNLTGVVVTFHDGATQATGIAVVNIARGMIVRQYVNNTLTYSGTHANAWQANAAVGDPVYVDDSHDLSEGCTLSFSPLNEDGVENPLAGWLWYCQDEYADAVVGGPNSAPTFDTTLLSSRVEQEFCILLAGGGGLT